MLRNQPTLLDCLAAGLLALAVSVLPQPAVAGTERAVVAYGTWLEFTGLAELVEVDEISEHPGALGESFVGEDDSRSEPSPRRYVLYLKSELNQASWAELSEAFTNRVGISLPRKLLSRFAQLLAVPDSEVRIDLALDCAWLSYVFDRAGKVQLDWSSPCAGPPGSDDASWRQRLAGLEGREGADYHVVEVFYGTDRDKTDSTRVSQRYGTERGSLRLGSCQVSIPRDHRVGLLEAPSLWRFEVKEDPAKHVILLSVDEQPEDRFIEALRETIRRSAGKAAFVFIHGYNVTFEGAARRAAQMAYDLQFDGAPMMYSWPSKGSLGGYGSDEVAIEWTVPHLRDFLSLVAAESGAEEIHLIAHSLGNRALTAVARQFVDGQTAPKFSQIALVAPDIDAEIFKRDVAPRIVGSGKRVTLYASSNDKVLDVAEKARDAPVAGQAGESIVVVPGIDTIDVSALDTSLLGHSYYGENRSVISDLFYLLRDQAAPENRFGLERIPLGELVYWKFRSAQ